MTQATPGTWAYRRGLVKAFIVPIDLDDPAFTQPGTGADWDNDRRTT
jgi:hypothetical protein